jgi:hypothetical protein
VRVSLFCVPRMMLVAAGQHAGSSARISVTRWVAVTVRPVVSLAVHVMMVVPGTNFAGALLVMVTADPLQISDARAVPMSTVPQL